MLQRGLGSQEQLEHSEQPGGGGGGAGAGGSQPAAQGTHLAANAGWREGG